MGHPTGRAERRERNARAMLAREADRTATRSHRTAIEAERVTIGGRSYTVADLSAAMREGDAR